MDANKKAGRVVEEAVPCPKCGAQPQTMKTGSHWRTCCPTAHILPVAGHTMKTKADAIREWNNAYKAK